MKLYSGPLSLFSRKVEIALREKDIPFERVEVPFSQTRGYSPRDPEVMAANPKGQVPVLVDGELTLYDSTLIFEYLEDAYSEPALYPRDPAERARCRLLDLFADEIMLVPLRSLMHRTEPRAENPGRWDASEAKAGPAEAALTGHFAELDRELQDRDFLCGAFSAADISVFMAVLWARRLRGAALRGHEALTRWSATLERRPAFSAVTAAIRDADQNLSAPVDGADWR